jgi:hypothetical protein
MDLETLVRPFQSPTPIGTRRITPVRTAVATETAGGRWGKPGNMPVPVEVPPGEDPLLVSFEVKKRKEHQDVSRETEKVRIQNPDDPDQYVIAERIKKITFKEKKAEAMAAYNAGSGTITTTTPGASPNGQWQPGETQVNSDGTQPGAQQSTYPLKVEERDYILNWPASPNEHPV